MLVRFALFTVAAGLLLAQEPSQRVLPRLVTTQWLPPENMTAEQAALLEKQVAAHPADINARRDLLAYYYRHAARAERVPHVYWMIEHQPDDLSLNAGYGDLPPDTPLASRSDYETGRSLWLSMVAKVPDNATVRMNAARYFEPYDLQLALDNLTAAAALPESEGGAAARQKLAMLMAKIIDVNAAPVDPASRAYLVDSSLLQRIRSDLENSNDARFLAQASRSIHYDHALQQKLEAKVQAISPASPPSPIPPEFSTYRRKCAGGEAGQNGASRIS